MATDVLLGHFTDQGIQNVKGSPARARAFQETAGQAGVKVKASYWTLGQYDFVVILEAPNDETLTAAVLSLAAQGNVRTQTLRAFDAEAVSLIVGKMP